VANELLNSAKIGLLPKFFSIPNSGCGVCWRFGTKLLRQHGHLPVITRLKGNHICNHGWSCEPALSTAVVYKTKCLASIRPVVKCFRDHLAASHGALGETALSIQNRPSTSDARAVCKAQANARIQQSRLSGWGSLTAAVGPFTNNYFYARLVLRFRNRL
jgi:hypothetical protein